MVISPISKVCEIINNETGSFEIVGSCCLKKFLSSKSETIVKSFSKLDKGGSVALPKQIIDISREYKVITLWDKNFYLKMSRKRNLNAMEITKKREIEDKIREFFIES